MQTAASNILTVIDLHASLTVRTGSENAPKVATSRSNSIGLVSNSPKLVAKVSDADEPAGVSWRRWLRSE